VQFTHDARKPGFRGQGIYGNSELTRIGSAHRFWRWSTGIANSGKAVQEQEAEIEELRGEVAALKSQSDKN